MAGRQFLDFVKGHSLSQPFFLPSVQMTLILAKSMAEKRNDKYIGSDMVHLHK